MGGRGKDESRVSRAGRHRMHRTARILQRRLPLHSLHRTLFRYYPFVFDFAGVSRHGSVLSRPHGRRRRKTIDSRGFGHLVAGGYHSLDSGQLETHR